MPDASSAAKTGISGARPATASLAPAGVHGWLGSERIRGEVSNLVVLRPTECEDTRPPAASVSKLVDAIQDAGGLKELAVKAVFDARRRSLPSSGCTVGWKIVEIMVDRAARVWLGVYESGSGPDSNWMVEFDDNWSPCGVSVKGSLDKRNIGETGKRVR